AARRALQRRRSVRLHALPLDARLRTSRALAGAPGAVPAAHVGAARGAARDRYGETAAAVGVRRRGGWRISGGWFMPSPGLRRSAPRAPSASLQRAGLAVAAAVVELEQRHVAAFVDGVVVAAVVDLVLEQVDLDEIDGNASLAGDDVGAQRTCAGGVVQLHCGLQVIRWRRQRTI